MTIPNIVFSTQPFATVFGSLQSYNDEMSGMFKWTLFGNYECRVKDHRYMDDHEGGMINC